MIQKTLIVLALALLIPPQAHAYLDPGNGSMMVQLLLAGLAGLMVSLKLFWRRILTFFSRSKSSGTEDKNPPFEIH